MKRNITVTAEGSCSAAPDTIEITLSLVIHKPEFNELSDAGSLAASEITAALGSCGFAETEIKTTGYAVSTEYESVLENERYVNRFLGYQLSHSLRIEFPLSDERLRAVLAALGNLSCAPQYHIAYQLADMDSLRNRAHSLAVSSCERRARLLTQTAGEKLGEIVSIQSWENGTMPMPREATFADSATMKCMSNAPSLHFDELSAIESVTIVWELV